MKSVGAVDFSVTSCSLVLGHQGDDEKFIRRVLSRLTRSVGGDKLKITVVQSFPSFQSVFQIVPKLPPSPLALASGSVMVAMAAQCQRLLIASLFLPFGGFFQRYRANVAILFR